MFQAKDVDGTPITHMQTLKGSAEECLVGVEEKVTALRVQAEECRQDSIEGILPFAELVRSGRYN